MSASLQEAVDHFRRRGCGALLDAPGVVCALPMTRRPRTGRPGRLESQDELIRTSLCSDATVPYLLQLYTDPARGGGGHDAGTAPSTSLPPQLPIPRVTLLAELGLGIKGFTGNAHGGLIVVLMDEVMGSLLFSNFEYQQRQAATAARGAEGAKSAKGGAHPDRVTMAADARLFTASMDVRLRRPIALPATVVATAAFSRVEGRKIYLDVAVCDPDGRAYATCTGMWMAVGGAFGVARL